MIWIKINSNLIVNVNAVTYLRRVAANNFTVALNNGETYNNLTLALINPLLEYIPAELWQ